ncbi:MAG: hypothetical protein PUA62_07330 [Lachnospiraceae bacterium]|nr:hypothetical protein [Lachnospiraceae bacterium]
MLKADQICLLGNDKRMDFAAQYFYDVGFDVSREYHDIGKSQVVVFSPMTKEQEIIDVLKYMRMKNIVFVGNETQKIKDICDKKEIELISYLSIPSLVTENAILTAKGIIKEAINCNAVLEASHCLVCGYGNCGKAIATELLKMNSYIDILVRRKEQKSEIEKRGYKCILFQDVPHISFEKYSYVFNTIPVCAIDQAILSKFTKTIIIFDIASNMGGIDKDYCMKHQIELHHKLGIPGKMFPRQAGELIAKEVYNYL